MAGWQPKDRRSERWHWRVSHLVWGAFTLFMMGWAFFLGLLVGQGSLGTPEQVASLKGLTSAVPGLGLLAAQEEQTPAPAKAEERLQQPQLNFYDAVERGQASAQIPAQPQAKPAPPAAVPPEPAPAGEAPSTLASAAPVTQATPAPQAAPAPQTAPAPPAPPVRTGPPILGKLEPFRPETAPPVDLAPPAARPVPPYPAPATRPYVPGPSPSPGYGAAQQPPAASRRGRLIVQVASFQEEHAARDLVSRLRSSGHPAYLVRSELEGVGPRFRVRVGPYEDIDHAQGTAGRIRLQHNLAAFVTREDQP